MKRQALLVLIGVLFPILLSGCLKRAEPAPVSIAAATDLHFAGREFYSYTGYFRQDSEGNGSGKQMQYLDDILDAFISQMLEEKPDFLLLTGDLTFIGARASHVALAQRLAVLSEAGIQVLAVPGNHDICSGTYIFPEGEPVEAPSITAQEFREIYAGCGYSGGISYDKNSLSYVYDTGKGAWIFMLDTNFRYGTGLGELSDDTMDWLKAQLKRCRRAGAYPLVAGHHNLALHNPLFNFGYVVSNRSDISALIKRYGGDLYLSGHLHTQHIAREEGLTDIVGGSLAVYPHRYGQLTLDGGQWEYLCKTTDVAGYEKGVACTDPNLLNYEEFGFQFFYDRIFAQAKEALSPVTSDEDLLFRLCDLSAKANVYYFAGTPTAIDRSDVEEMRRLASDTFWADYLETIFACTEDSLYCTNTP